MTWLDLDEKRARRALSVVRPATDNHDWKEIFACAVMSGLAEPGDRHAGELVQQLGAVEAIECIRGARNPLRGGLKDGAAVAAEGESAAQRWGSRLNPSETLRQLERLAAIHGRLLTSHDGLWPQGLEDLGPHAPFALWTRGKAEMLNRLSESIAIVGARASSGYGEHVVMEHVGPLAESGMCIVSGAAYGIDGMAHRTALAVGGPTIAVLAGGVDRFYPSGHDALLHRIVESGLVLSEMPCGFAPTKWRFLQRNRLIAALSTATVVIEAGKRSGSLNTAYHAFELGRPVGVVPGPVTSGSSVGCHRLLRGTEALCVTNSEEMRQLLPQFNMQYTYTPYIDMSDEEVRVHDALSLRAWRDVNRIARDSGVALPEVMAALTSLEVQEMAQTDGVGWKRLSVR